ncbi:glucosidase 2 subunit beta-like isoform X2 [Adelges cooleyi]|uniref:glucosidase 2 subunit beta-like isoform X2 n=1 Tax=Adelges cooleyi TaxID=133065 RepID=UPI00217F80BC|nr:glucosidase 2 subunit beta-like isoform X2 [Adelges cooleyi]
MEICFIYVTSLHFLITLICCADVGIKGIALKNAQFYIQNKDFSCLDGSNVIPYSYINDDYCDCLDASDEPDCCDGSDEWRKSEITQYCENTCQMLGNAAKEEAKKIELIFVKGFEIRTKLVIKGKQLKTDKQHKIVELQSKERVAQDSKNEAQHNKEIAEKIEKITIKKYGLIPIGQKSNNEKSKDEIEVADVFNTIDINKNNKIEKEEMNSFITFDLYKDSLIPQDDINYFMDDKKELTYVEFSTISWNRLKLMIFNDKSTFPIQDKSVKAKPSNVFSKQNASFKRFHKSLYDEIKSIFNEAENARKSFEEAGKRLRVIQKELYDIKEFLKKDYGPDDEFAILYEKCFEFHDTQYIYKLCLFSHVTQQSKTDKSFISLGTWKSWNNLPKYNKMLYDKGEDCWNGPQRSTEVHLSCGLIPSFISVSEPNRCKYVMEFILPAACTRLQNIRHSEAIELEHDPQEL